MQCLPHNPAHTTARLRPPNSLHLCPVPLVISSISWLGAGQVMSQLSAPGPAGVGRVWVEAAVPALSASLWD